MGRRPKGARARKNQVKVLLDDTELEGLDALSADEESRADTIRRLIAAELARSLPEYAQATTPIDARELERLVAADRER